MANDPPAMNAIQRPKHTLIAQCFKLIAFSLARAQQDRTPPRRRQRMFPPDYVLVQKHRCAIPVVAFKGILRGQRAKDPRAIEWNAPQMQKSRAEKAIAASALLLEPSGSARPSRSTRAESAPAPRPP